MQNIVIDEEFRALLPQLDKETYARLEENLLENGCRDSLVLWGDILVDGHNRFAICSKHNIPFNTINKEFTSREEALIWIISTQVARRNLTPIQLSHYRGLHYRADKRIQGTNLQYFQENEKAQNEPFNFSTATRLAEQYHVSRNTIKRDAKVAQGIDAIGEVSPEAKRMVLSGEATINKKDLQELSSKSPKELAKIATSIENGTYEKEVDRAPQSLEQSATSATAGFSVSPARTTPQQLDTNMEMMTQDFLIEWQNHLDKNDRVGLRLALRTHIDRLEDYYRFELQ